MYSTLRCSCFLRAFSSEALLDQILVISGLSFSAAGITNLQDHLINELL